MAMKEVVLDESDRSESKYVTFKAIGDKLVGRYVSHRTVSGKYGDKVEFTFRTKAGDKIVNPPANLAQKLKKSLEKGLLKPGYLCVMKFTSTQDIGKESPMRVITLEIDDAPPPTPKPVEDDVPF